MIPYSRGKLYTMECHITPPPPPSTNVLQKLVTFPRNTLTTSTEIFTWRKTDARTKTTAMGSGPTESSSIIYTLQNTLMSPNVNIIRLRRPGCWSCSRACRTASGPSRASKDPMPPCARQCLRSSTCSLALRLGCYFCSGVWATSDCLL